MSFMNAYYIVVDALLPDPELQRIIMAIPGLGPLLAHNTRTPLANDVWLALYPTKPKPPASQAVALAGRRLSAELVDHVVAVETRSQPLQALLYGNTLTAAQQARLMHTKGFTATVAKALFEDPTCAPELRRQVATAAGGKALTTWLATASREEISDADVVELFARFDDWAPRRSVQRRQDLLSLFHCRPQIISAVVATGHEDLYMTLAGCRHLTSITDQWRIAGLSAGQTSTTLSDEDAISTAKFTYMALGNNPVTFIDVTKAMRAVCENETDPMTRMMLSDAQTSLSARLSRLGERPQVTVPYEEIDDAAVIDWLVGRSVAWKSGFGGGYRPARAWDLAALAVNPHLDANQANRVFCALNDFEEEIVPSVDELRHGLCERYEHLRPANWGEVPELDGDASEDAPSTASSFHGDTRANAPTQPFMYDPRVIAALPLDSVRSLGQMDAAMALIASTVTSSGANKAVAFQTLFGLVDQFEGTIGELAELITLV